LLLVSASLTFSTVGDSLRAITLGGGGSEAASKRKRRKKREIGGGFFGSEGLRRSWRRAREKEGF